MNCTSCTAVCLRRTRRPKKPFQLSVSSTKRRELPTLSFLSLQFRQPYLDLRIILRPRAPLGQVDAILNSLSDSVGHLAVRAFPEHEGTRREKNSLEKWCPTRTLLGSFASLQALVR